MQMNLTKLLIDKLLTLWGRLPRPIGRLGVWLYGHRAQVGGWWGETGKTQFDFLRSNGLRKDHVFAMINNLGSAIVNATMPMTLEK